MVKKMLWVSSSGLYVENIVGISIEVSLEFNFEDIDKYAMGFSE